MIKGVSLFANVGIDEFYLKECGVSICISNELIEKRADFYSHIYKDVEMIKGDILNEEVFNQLVLKFKENKCEFLLATPPCQGMSVAGKMKESDPRNSLTIKVIEFIKLTKPNYILIENVPQIFNFCIIINGIKVKIPEYIKQELEPLGYIINSSVLDSADYGTPQFRKRAIFLISKFQKWEIPQTQNHISVKDAIGDLPSLESGEHSGIKNHYAKKHNINHIKWMKHTPTGKTAFENEIHFPVKDGRRIKGFSTTYKRIEWERPAPTITMCNGGISSQNNVHPGRKKPDGTYSDARVLTILELLRLTGLPDNYPIPEWASENLIRQVVGECFPPKFCASLVKNIKLPA
jgi:DNA (cytosine-5)-methyltransferase 1